MANMLLVLFPVVSAAISLAVLLLVIVRFQKNARVMPPASVRNDPTADAFLRTEVSSLARRVSELESTPLETASGVVRSGMNLSKRTQALRQHRLGQTPATIAKSLDMTEAEVTLLLKIQNIVSRN